MQEPRTTTPQAPAPSHTAIDGIGYDWDYGYDQDYANVEGEDAVIVYLRDPHTQEVLDALGGIVLESLSISDHGNVNVSPDDETYLHAIARELAETRPAA